jgi:hypothetical protein
MTRRSAEQAIAVLSSLTAVNDAGGAWYGLSGAPNVPPEWLEGSVFRSYRAPSVILGVMVGGSADRGRGGGVAQRATPRGRSRSAPAASSPRPPQVAIIGLQSAAAGDGRRRDVAHRPRVAAALAP